MSKRAASWPPFLLTFPAFCGVLSAWSLRNSVATVAIPFVNGFFRACDVVFYPRSILAGSRVAAMPLPHATRF